ncbi:hypothetical protein CD790_21335 [Streptomyces sp. SAJ15]|nr:hypothetical protein CD790_21335 [Streptomyces sp. SAJ15]
MGTGFEHSSWGGESAAITYAQDLDIIDDITARKQLEAITSRDSRPSIDRRVSDVRALREAAGLSPSGGAPDGVTFTTVVKAARATSLDDKGDLLEVWMVLDRYATTRGKGGDDDPLKDQLDCFIVKWEDGDWKLVDESRYVSPESAPGAYDRNSTASYDDGWREVVSA